MSCVRKTQICGHLLFTSKFGIVIKIHKDTTTLDALNSFNLMIQLIYKFT